MINHKFISVLEGNSTVGYVPEPDGGAIESGVTIASGFDIGQRTVDELDDAFAVELADKLAPYAGLTGYAAIRALEDKPLEIANFEADIINEHAHKKATKLLLDDWHKTDAPPFGSIHPALQTVIASVAYQYGDLPTRTPNFWRQATTGDINGMLGNLCNFKDRFPSRRRKEAKYLFDALNAYGEYENLRRLVYS